MRTMLMVAVMTCGCTEEKHLDPHVLNYDGCVSAWATTTRGAPVCEVGCIAGPVDPPLFGDGVYCPIPFGFSDGKYLAEYDGKYGACAVVDTITLGRPDGTPVTVDVMRWFDVDIDRCR